MKCHVVQKWLLSDYLDGECPASVSAEVKAHLHACSDCRTAYAEIKAGTVEPLMMASEAHVPSAVLEGIEHRVESFEREPKDPGFERLGYALDQLNMRFPKVFRKRVAFILAIIFMFSFGALFTLQHSPYRGQVWEAHHNEEFYYIFSRTRMDVYEQEEGFGTSIEEMFL